MRRLVMDWISRMCKNFSEVLVEYREPAKKIVCFKRRNEKTPLVKWQSHLNSFQINLVTLNEKTKKSEKIKEMEEAIDNLTEKK